MMGEPIVPKRPTKRLFDHEDLLRRYIEHVGGYEGTDFLSDGRRDRFKRDFTDEEWAELRRLGGWNAR
jgi:hypothetical protein